MGLLIRRVPGPLICGKLPYRGSNQYPRLDSGDHAKGQLTSDHLEAHRKTAETATGLLSSNL